MFDRLFSLIQSLWESLVFWFIVDPYERAVVLRLGHFHREVGPGPHLKIPMGVERVLVDNIVPRTSNLGEQTLVTSDDKNVVVSGICTIRILDLRRALLSVESLDDATTDVMFGVIGDAVTSSTWAELRTGAIRTTIMEEANIRLEKCGITVDNFDFGDMAPIRSIRLLME